MCADRSSSSHLQPDINDNKIPEPKLPVLPTVNEVDVIRESNEIPGLRSNFNSLEDPSDVKMSHAGEDSIFNKTEVLAGQ